MAALDWIAVEGFKSIKRIERLVLTPINLVIGANGSGKSNLIGVFTFLRELRAGRLREYVIRSGGADRILHFGSRATSETKVRVSLEGEVLVTDRVDGGTQLTRLDAADLQEWLQDYSLGQLWEKNHFGGRAGRSGAERP
ncbi:MAG: AAA family ATPase [Acidobacteriota bacterium]|nr:AAA family ATPase [Acidobacteriota bacterium]